MKLSIITVVFNAHATIKDAITSVLGQTFKDIEYIIIDGRSTDGTVEIIRSFGDRITKFVSEPDKGMYDAMNKGIKLATGDIIGILNSDDIYANNMVLEAVVSQIEESKSDCSYGDLVYVDRNDMDKIVRFWKSGEYNEESFKNGWMPAHPTFFVKRWVYEKYGTFDLSLPIASDYEIVFRFMEKYKIKSCYVPNVLVKMRLGGVSNKSFLNILKQNLVTIRILKENKIKVSPFFLCFKFMEKLKQFQGVLNDKD